MQQPADRVTGGVTVIGPSDGRPAWPQAVVAVGMGCLAVVSLPDRPVVSVLYALLAVGNSCLWWFGSGALVTTSGGDLVVRSAWGRSLTWSRDSVTAVRVTASRWGRERVRLDLRDGTAVELPLVSRRVEVGSEQARRLRSWAGLSAQSDR